MANQDLVLGQTHNMSLEQHPYVSHHDHTQLGLEEDHNTEPNLGHTHDDHEEGGNHENYVHQTDQKPDNSMGLSEQNNELALLDNHVLAVSEHQEIDDNLELAVVHNDEMGMEETQEINGDELVVAEESPIIQARTIVASPSYELAVGQEFPDVKSCRRALRDTAIALHFEIQTIKSDKTRFTAKCAGEGCPWRIHAAKLPGVPTFTIRTINGSHTCGGIAHLGHQQASVQWVAESVEQRLLENPNCKPKEILEEIHRVHGMDSLLLFCC